jgi:hypothetical protein
VSTIDINSLLTADTDRPLSSTTVSIADTNLTPPPPHPLLVLVFVCFLPLNLAKRNKIESTLIASEVPRLFWTLPLLSLVAPPKALVLGL